MNVKNLAGRVFDTHLPANLRNTKLYWSLFGAVVLLGTGLRFWHLGDVPIWQDEAITRAFAQLDLWTLLTKNIDNHPPLSYVVQHFWHQINPSTEATRVPVAIAGSVSVAVLMLFLRDSAGGRVALAGGLLFALSTSSIAYSQDARMYAFAILGLIIAAWGAVGFAQGGQLKPRAYAALYIAGSAIAIYSHLIGLMAMACIGTASLGAAVLANPKDWRATLLRWFTMNLILLIVVLPWLLRLPVAIKSFPGLWETQESMAAWYIFNIVGFPGLETFAKPAELILIVFAFLSVPLCWLAGKRALGLVIGAMLVAYPLLIIVLNSNSSDSLISNRVFVPIAIASVAGLGLSISMVRSRIAATSILMILVSASAISAVNQIRYGIKPDDFRAAFEFADANGYENAPAFTCNTFCAASAWENRPGAEIYDFRRGDLMRYHGPEFWQATRNSILWVRQASVSQLDAELQGEWFVPGGAAEVLKGHTKAIVLMTSCDGATDDEARLVQSLADAGFSSPAGVQRVEGRSRGRVIMVGPETRVMLFERTGLEQAPAEGVGHQSLARKLLRDTN